MAKTKRTRQDSTTTSTAGTRKVRARIADAAKNSSTLIGEEPTNMEDASEMQKSADSPMDIDIKPTEDSENTARATRSRSAAAKKKKDITPRDPLPERVNRVQQPGLPDAPRSRRTSEQVVTAAREKAAAEEALRVEKATNRRMLAVMMVAEEEKRLQEEASMPEACSNLVVSSGDELEVSSDSDEFPSTCKESSDDPDAPPPKRKTPKLNARRGAVRGMVDEVERAERIRLLEEQLKGLKAKGKAKVASKAASTSSSSKQLSFPPGLAPSYKKATTLNLVKSSKNKKDELNIGGLQDMDAAAGRPKAVVTKTVVHIARKAPLINISDSSDSETPAPATSQPKTPARKSKNTPQTPDSSKAKLPLPAFALKQNNWRNLFLPTLYAIYFANPEPFVNFRKGGGEFHNIVQVVVDLVFPDEEYAVTTLKDDAIYHTAYDRVGEKQSAIRRDAEDAVKNYFTDSQFKNKPSLVMSHAIWGSLPNGVGICATPTPRKHMNLKHGDEGYVAPDGICLSPIMISVMKGVYSHSNDTVKDFGHPIGLVAVAAAAVTRAFRMYSKNGAREKDFVGPFSEKMCGDIVASYVKMASKFSDNHWARIYSALCKVDQSKSAALQLNTTKGTAAVHDAIDNIYQRSSPPPGE
ncbi:hypothetical protein AAF712_014434 [Marasmius tenuissimus]|uniref:Uncharacterized protein n=1 Tax=Marasmius tenuissimus TaxID=585030 RepID=A0ABR2ZBY5_9AGAR